MFYFVLHAVYLLHCFGTHLLCFYRSQQAGTDLSYVSGVCCVRGTSRHGQDSDVSRITTRKSNTEVRRRHQCIEIRNIYLIQYLKMRSGLLFRQTTNGQDCCAQEYWFESSEQFIYFRIRDYFSRIDKCRHVGPDM